MSNFYTCSYLQCTWHRTVFFKFIYWQAPCPNIFIISFCIQYLCVNLGHRSPRVMSLGTCVGWSVLLLGHILVCLLCSCRDLKLHPLECRLWLTRVHCLSLKPDMDREVRSHPDFRISAKVQSWELGLSRVLRPDDHRNHPELQHVSSFHYRLCHQFVKLLQNLVSIRTPENQREGQRSNSSKSCVENTNKTDCISSL